MCDHPTKLTLRMDQFSGAGHVADAAGPEMFTFEEMLRLLAPAVGARVQLVHTPRRGWGSA